MSSDLPASRDDRYFEDYVPGAVYEFAEGVTVDKDEIVEFASRYDPQSFHVDPEAAEHGPFGGLIASGWHTGSLMMRLMVDNFLPTVASLGSPGIDELRWAEPVRPDDTLRLRITVLDARPSESKPDRGVMRGRVELVNQHDRVVLSLTATNFLTRRHPG
jgi:acyl dehydratase